MIARATPLAFGLATLLGLMLFLGVLADRVELFIAAIPLALGLLGMASPVHPAGLTVRHHVSANRVVEGDRLLVTLTVTVAEPVPMVEILAVLPPLVEADRGGNRVVLAVDPAQETCWSFDVRCPARGRFELGTLYIRIWDWAGLSVVETRQGIPEPILVYPFAERVRQVPRMTRTQHSFGNYVSPRMGEGIEPGEIRPFLPGDRTRHINWRASLRRQQLYVTQFHEERNADVVLLLDTLCDVGAPPYSTLDLSVRASATLANAYLTRKDRVGFVEFGPFLRWINPATGRRQGELLAEGLLPAATYFSYVVPQLDRLPMRVLPRGALVVAISPLLDERFVKAAIDLAARGFDVVVLAVSPIEPTRRIVSASMLDDLACRLWAMEWRVKLDELRGRGLMIVEWHPDTLLETVLAPLSGSRPRWTAQR